MRSFINLTGKRFGHLLVIKRSKRRTSSNIQWICKCECGRFLIVRGDNLRSGHSTQCGECKSRGMVRSVFIEEGDIDVN